MADISFQFAYKVPDQEDNTVALSTELLFTQSDSDVKQVVRQCYSKTLFSEVDREDIKRILK
jgi:Mg/Co/Ni transporter MgtE